MINHLVYQEIRQKYIYWALLISLILSFVATPFFESSLHPNIFVIASILLSVVAVSTNKIESIGALVLAILMLFFTSFSFAYQDSFSLLMTFCTTCSFFLYIVFSMLRQIFKNTKVDTNILLSSICIYFSLAIVWAMLYGLIQEFYPGSFSFNQEGGIRKKLNDLMYFSFVTLTTVGYGDITPTSEVSKVLAAMEALIGQIYLTVLVARLVGLHIAENQ